VRREGEKGENAKEMTARLIKMYVSRGSLPLLTIIHIQLLERYRQPHLSDEILLHVAYMYCQPFRIMHILKRGEHSAEKAQSLSLMRKTKSKSIIIRSRSAKACRLPSFADHPSKTPLTDRRPDATFMNELPPIFRTQL
jgi:hypothetical protein